MNRRSVVYAGAEIIEDSMVEVSWDELRSVRNRELEKSDWRFMSDQTPSDEWILFRTFLRDLPQNHEDANSACDALNDYDKPEGA